MSMMPMMETKQCECGNLYKTDCSTLGIRRNRCGVCSIKKMLEEPKDIVGVIYFIVTMSGFNEADYKKVTTDLLNTKLSSKTIESGIEDSFLEEATSIFNNNTINMIEIRDDLTEYLREERNIHDFINILLKKFDSN